MAFHIVTQALEFLASHGLLSSGVLESCFPVAEEKDHTGFGF